MDEIILPKTSKLEYVRNTWKKFHREILGLFAVIVLCSCVLLLYHFFISPPKDFSTGIQTTIAGGGTPEDIARQLYDAGLIRSPRAFALCARLLGADTHLNEGIYTFDTRLNLVSLIQRIGNGEHGIAEIAITFTEGMTSRDMAEKIQSAIPAFNTEIFLEKASSREGYLFPDTYFILATDTPEEILGRLEERFNEQIQTLATDITQSKRSREDIVIMASIIEREAKYEKDKHIVADILWKRIDQKMRLQVDAVFGYVHKVNGYTPTRKDLESDSPYNTYREYGLPPTPIANPGLESLQAAATQEKTPYLFYLTGTDGNMYYARNFEEHKRNRALYLDI